MNDLIKTSIHFCNLSYTNNEYIRLSLLDDANLEEEPSCNKESIYYIKQRNIIPTINCKLHIGLPNILHCIYNNKLYISFPGISSNIDKINCLSFNLQYNIKMNCNIHRGFIYIFNKLQSEIELIIDVFADTYDEIIFTGHSLGGAIAKYSALYFKLHKKINIKCITFACPLIGDNTFAEQFNKYITNSFTLCCQKDFLVKIPFNRQCDYKNKYMINDDKEIIPYKNICSSYIYNFLKFNLDSHRLDYYMKVIIKTDFTDYIIC